MTRKMSRIEQAQTLVNEFSSMAAIGVIRCRHLPPPPQLQQGLLQLQQKHPLLQTEIKRQQGVLTFVTVTPAPPIPQTIIYNATEDAWQAIVAEAMNSPASQQAPLMRVVCLYLADSDQADLITIFHHAMMDAFSGMRFLEELLALLGGQQMADVTPQPLPPPCEALFPPELYGIGRWRRLARFMANQVRDELSYRWQTRNGRFPLIAPATTGVPLTRRLSVATTRQLSRAARHQDVTLNSVVATAQLLAVHRHLYQQHPRPLRMMIFANLRPYLQPPVATETLGCYITPTRQTVPLSATPDFWQVACHIQQTVTTAMRRGDGFINALLSKQLVQFINGRQTERFGATAISYVGPIPLQPAYGPIELVDLHAFLANNRLGPEFTAFCHIFQGQLSWDFVYLTTDMDAATADLIADETCRLLEQMSQPASQNKGTA